MTTRVDPIEGTAEIQCDGCCAYNLPGMRGCCSADYCPPCLAAHRIDPGEAGHEQRSRFLDYVTMQLLGYSGTRSSRDFAVSANDFKPTA